MRPLRNNFGHASQLLASAAAAATAAARCWSPEQHSEWCTEDSCWACRLQVLGGDIRHLLPHAAVCR